MACTFFRDFSFLEFSTYLSNIPHHILRVGEYFFCPAQKTLQNPLQTFDIRARFLYNNITFRFIFTKLFVYFKQTF